MNKGEISARFLYVHPRFSSIVILMLIFLFIIFLIVLNMLHCVSISVICSLYSAFERLFYA